MRGQPGSDLYALRQENASLRQVCPLCSTSTEVRAVLGGRHLTTAQLAIQPSEVLAALICRWSESAWTR